ncbi:hypothetical protein ES703_110567 [subsurface metagenome]
MPPSAGSSVDDLDLCHFAFKFPHVPEMPFELFVVLADCCTHHLAVDKEIDARLSCVIAPADEEVNELPVNFERL